MMPGENSLHHNDLRIHGLPCCATGLMRLVLARSPYTYGFANNAGVLYRRFASPGEIFTPGTRLDQTQICGRRRPCTALLCRSGAFLCRSEANNTRSKRMSRQKFWGTAPCIVIHLSETYWPAQILERIVVSSAGRRLYGDYFTLQAGHQFRKIAPHEV